jgi:hypothetical protein
MNLVVIFQTGVTFELNNLITMISWPGILISFQKYECVSRTQHLLIVHTDYCGNYSF